MSVPQTPRPPCAAYLKVAPHVHPSYFTRPPVDDGIELTVTSRSDRLPSRWVFSHDAADAIEIRLRRDPDLTVTRSAFKRRAA